MKKAGCGMAAVLLASLMFVTAHAGSPPTVNAEPMDLDPDIAAKIGKEKSKRSTIADGMKQGRIPGSKSSDCGSVNIASGDKNKSNSGIKEMMGKQQTTIVMGPVLNMANCK